MKNIDKLFSNFKNQYGMNVGEIRLYSSIGEGWGEDGAVEFNNKLDKMRECDEIHVRINSGGGSVFSGNAIYASLKRFPKPVKVFVDGIAASIASVIMCAGDEVYCPSNAVIMVHRPLNQVAGNVDDMKENIAILEKIQETIEEAYLNKCGKKITRDNLQKLMVGDYKDGTWLTAKEAQELGFVDIIEDECLAVAEYKGSSNVVINGVKMDLSQYKNLDKVKEMIDKAQSYGNLPLAPRDNQWDAPAADKRVRAFFKCQDKPNAQYKKAFLWYDETKSDLFGSYKLPFADVVDGQLKAVYRGLSAAKGRLNQTDIPASDKAKVEEVLRKYYNKASKEYNDPSISYDNKLEETNMSKEKQSLLEAINNVAKAFLGIKDETEPENSIQEETTEDSENITETQEENLEVQDEQTQNVEDVAEETEVQNETVEPSAEVLEENEPSNEAEPVATEEKPKQEETEEVQQEQEITQEPEQVEEETPEENEPSEEVEPKAVVVPEVNASVDLVSELAKVKDELAKIKEADALKAVALVKAELAKEVENKFKGVPGKLEDKVELIYELKNSTLSNDSKEMIFKSLENLSTQNLKDCEEIGHSEEIIVDENDKMSKAKALAQKEGISEGKAILVLDGTKTLKQVKNEK